MQVPFNRPLVYDNELEYIGRALEARKLSGAGPFTKKCQELMEQRFGAGKVLLTTSCTHALDMAAILAELEPGDEVICPSYTFVSTANSIVLRGARPVFVDIREDTLNIDEEAIEDRITDRTKAVLPVHYAGVGCEMDRITAISKKHGLTVIEDAAQGVNARYKGRSLGTIGDLGAYSFHETKNYSCGEGGALVINDQALVELAEIVREKGTNRSKFFRGEVDKYTWVDIGSSYLPSEILAAFLYRQLEAMDEINDRRREIFERYREGLRDLEEQGVARLPSIPPHCETNYHMFYVLVDGEKRDRLLEELKGKGVHAVFHYIPLHTSPMGRRFGYMEGDLPVTELLASRIIRLPMFYDLADEQVDYVVKSLRESIEMLA